MSEPELLNRIAELEARNLELLAKNERFRKMLGLLQKNSTTHTEIIQLPDIPKQDNNTKAVSKSSINKYSTPDEKIELFLSLFQGRTDVYAKRCYSKKHDSSYYIPACKNGWVKYVFLFRVSYISSLQCFDTFAELALTLGSAARTCSEKPAPKRGTPKTIKI